MRNAFMAEEPTGRKLREVRTIPKLTFTKSVLFVIFR